MNDTDCLFCKIVAGDIPSDIVLETDAVVAFRDIDPKAPTHVLVVPRVHHADVTDVAAADPAVLADMVDVAQRIADAEADGQFRVIFNVGPRAGQSVFHAHGHVLAGTELGWTPA